MTLICNAGPIIALAKIDQLPLLEELADTVMIPTTVFHELLAKPGTDADHIIEVSQSFLKIEEPPQSITPEVMLASQQLDAGEKQVIALASSTTAPFTVLLDDAAGRRVARRLGYPLLGFVGILLIAKQRGLVPDVSSLLAEARDQGYWLSDELLNIARSLAKE